MCAFVKPREKVLRLAEQQIESLVLEGQLLSAWTGNLLPHLEDNSQAPELTIYLHMYLRVSYHRSGVNSMAVTRLVWTAVILNSSGTSGPLSNGRTQKMYSYAVYIKFLVVQRVGSSEPPRTPKFTGQDIQLMVQLLRRNLFAKSKEWSPGLKTRSNPGPDRNPS